MEEWERVSANQWSAKTHEGYASILSRHLLPSFGERDLKKISVIDVERYIAMKVEDGLNPLSVKHHVVLLKTILNSAIRQGIILQNPVVNAKMPKVARYIPQTYTAEQIAKLLNELMGTHVLCNHVRCLLDRCPARRVVGSEME
ncbi:MAG: site-specific integrase [Bacilli bacterium]